MACDPRAARNDSNSENRQLGGHLGWVEPSKLPAALEEVVFSLPTSGTSEPLPTAGGAFLVHVSDVILGVEVSKAEARRASVARLRELALEPEPSLEAAEAQLRELREALVAARLDLDGAVQELRGRGFETEAVEARWLDPVALRALEPKVRAYLTQLADTGHTVPFHLNGVLQLLHVAERREPSPLPFADVRERVVQDYYQRHRQRLYQELASELLDEAGFLFYEELLRRHLDSLGVASP